MKISFWIKKYLSFWYTRNRGKVVFYAVLLCLIFPVFFFQIRSNDLWTALYSGRYLSLFHKLPHHSTFTFSPVVNVPSYFSSAYLGPVHWGTYNWLPYVILYNLYKLGGIPTLQLFRLALGFLVVFLLHSLVRYRCNGLILSFLVLFSHGIYLRTSLRNYIFSIPLLLLLFWLWQKSRYEERIQYVYFIPLILLVWSNMHASYLIGLGSYGLLLIGDFIDGYWRDFDFKPTFQARAWSMVPVSLMTIIAVKPIPDYLWINFTGKFLEGGGLKLKILLGSPGITGDVSSEFLSNNHTWIQILGKLIDVHRTLLLPDRVTGISGYAHPINYLDLRYVQACLILIPIGIVSFTYFAKRIRLSNCLLAFFIMVTASGRLRTLAFIPLVTIPLIFIKYNENEFQWPALPKKWASLLIHLSLAVVLILSTYHLVNGSYNRFMNIAPHKLRWGTWKKYSSEMPEKILQNYPEEKFFNNFGIGSFLIWKWWPYKKVYFDPKWVPYRVEFIQHRLRKIYEYDLRYAIMSRSVPRLHKLFLQSNHWKILMKNPVMVSYVRPRVPTPIEPEKPATRNHDRNR